MRAGIVIVAWNGETFLPACLQSLLAQRTLPADIVVVDNASDDDSAALVEGFTASASDRGVRVTLLRQIANLGFTRGTNVGIAELSRHTDSCDCLVLLNQDAALDPDWLETVWRVFQSDRQIGVVGTKLLLPNRLTIQHAGGYLERPRLVGKHYGHHEPDRAALHVQREVDFVTGAAMAVRAETLEQVGPFQEIFSPGYYEDVDLCVRASEHGWKVVYCPDAAAVHVESGSFANRVRRLAQSHRSRLIYAMRWLGDPRFREEFFRAERQYVRARLTTDERRALTAAYLMALLILDDALAARLPPPDVSSALRESLAAQLVELRREIVALPW